MNKLGMMNALLHIADTINSAQVDAVFASKACEARRTLVACQKSTRSWVRVMRGVASLGKSTSSFSEALCMHHTLPSSLNLWSSEEELSVRRRRRGEEEEEGEKEGCQ